MVTVLAEVVHQDHLQQVVLGGRAQDAVHGAQQRGPGFVVEADDHAGRRQVLWVLLLETPEETQTWSAEQLEVGGGGVASSRTPTHAGCRASGRLRCTEMPSLTASLKPYFCTDDGSASFLGSWGRTPAPPSRLSLLVPGRSTL